MKPVQKISGNIVDVVSSRIYPGTIEIDEGRIKSITRGKGGDNNYIIPGLVDSHVHIESSMLIPSRFASVAVRHGVVASVSDPHEIANVLGLQGVEYMIEDGERVPFKFYFGAPSCVPATRFETSGAEIDAQGVKTLLQDPRIKYLSEMMNVPGVVYGEGQVMEKLTAAKRLGKRIDGHAPGLRGEWLEKYVQAGISTDHECFELDEALEKIGLGMKILIREGSAAKNFDELGPLIREYPDSCMLCSDDRHPDDLVAGSINHLVKRGVALGLDIMDVLRCATLNPVRHYDLEVGLLQPGDLADFIVVENLEDFRVFKTCIEGNLVYESGKILFDLPRAQEINNFSCLKKGPSDFLVRRKQGRIRVMEVIEGQLLTGEGTCHPTYEGDCLISDPERDILKITVVNRYRDAAPAVAFVKNFGLKGGALASSVAHDSHNIVAVGVSDEELAETVNLVIGNKGGLSLVSPSRQEVLPLPVGGIMTTREGEETARTYSRINKLAKGLGTHLSDPFMALSFTALLVIPKLKLSDGGLFDGEDFEFVDLYVK